MLTAYISVALLLPALVASYNNSALDPRKVGFCRDHICGIDAKCNSITGKCSCPRTKPVGSAYLRCLDDPLIECNIVGDPSVTGFPEDLIFADFANCPYILTVFDAKVTTPLQFGGRQYANAIVRFNVEATNGYTPSGEIFVETIRILATLRVEGFSLPSLEITINADSITYQLNVRGFVAVRVDKNDTVGCKSRPCFNTNLPLTACFDKSTNAFNLNFAFATTNFFFRGNEESHGGPRQKPGFSIATDIDNSIFFKESLFPQAFCDSVTHDIPKVYNVECRQLGFKDKRACGFYASATNASGTELSPSCRRLVAAFNASSSSALGVQAAKTCSIITTRFLKCLPGSAQLADLLADCVNIVGSGRQLDADFTARIRSSKAGCSAEVVNGAFGVPSYDLLK